MESKPKYTLPKAQRLCSRNSIQQLMTEGRALRVGCLRISYLFVDRSPSLFAKSTVLSERTDNQDIVEAAAMQDVTDRQKEAAEEIRFPAVRVLFVASKRMFRKAVARNRAKRLLREAYRMQKNVLLEAISGKAKGVILAVQCQRNQQLTYQEVNADMAQALPKVVERWQAYHERHSTHPKP